MDGLTKAHSLISHKAYFSGDVISEPGSFAHFIGCDNFNFQFCDNLNCISTVIFNSSSIQKSNGFI